MTNAYPPKFADEVLDYSWDWSARLLDGESITGSVELTEGDETVDVDRIATEGAVTTFWVNAGGRIGMPLKISLLATTSAGRKIGATLVVPIRSR